VRARPDRSIPLLDSAAETVNKATREHSPTGSDPRLVDNAERDRPIEGRGRAPSPAANKLRRAAAHPRARLFGALLLALAAASAALSWAHFFGTRG
jgi:hypothetical protein